MSLFDSSNMASNLASLFKHGLVFTLVIFAMPGLVGCSRADVSPSPVASPSPHITPVETMLRPDILITPAQSGQVISVSVGQVIGVTNPGATMEWQVDYASAVLELLTPRENLRAPGPEGWRFRSIAPGQTDLVLTSIPQPCPNNTPCPLMPARFVFTIKVKSLS